MSPTKDPFASFNEKILVDDVSIISWCPTADLVLLVSIDGSMSLFRNENVVKKIWKLDPMSDSKIKIVTWKPNGKEFVAGCDDGVVFKVDITYHEPRTSKCWSPGLSKDSGMPYSVTSLVWTNYEYKKKQMDIEGFDVDAFDSESALPLLSEESPEEPVSHLLPRARKKVQLPTKPLKNNEVQTLLFIGNSIGEIHIILNGIYPIGSININEKGEDNAILDISIQQNLLSLQLLTKSVSKNNNNNFVLQEIDTHFLEDQKEQVFGISEIQTKLNYLLEYVRINMDVLKRHHTSYVKLNDSVRRKASDSILNQNEQATAMPEVELTGTLAIGSVTDTLQEFFVESLTSAHIRTWETNTTHGHQNSLKVVCEHILPACERIQLELSKLLGYSLWTQRYGDFLETASVEGCVIRVIKLVAHIHLFTKDLNELITSFQAFVKWIAVISQKVTTDPESAEYPRESILCEDPELVLKFLNTDFINDSLAKYFIPENNTDNKGKWVTLIEMLNELKNCCGQMLEKPSGTISKKIKVSSKSHFRLQGISLVDQPRDKVVSCTTKGEDDVQYNYYAFLMDNPNAKLIILKNCFGRNAMTEYALLDVTGDITDMEFFDDKELGLCVQQDEQTTLLSTILLENLDFRNLTEPNLVSEQSETFRSQSLQRMIKVKLGCNGLPRRRILSVVASNSLMRILSMEEDEEEDEEENEETEDVYQEEDDTIMSSA